MTKIRVTYKMRRGEGIFETCTDLPIEEAYADLLLNAERIPNPDVLFGAFAHLRFFIVHNPEMILFDMLFTVLESLTHLQGFEKLEEIETIERIDDGTAAAD